LGNLISSGYWELKVGVFITVNSNSVNMQTCGQNGQKTLLQTAFLTK